MVDYSYYTQVYKGAVIPETAFTLIEMKASQHIRVRTFGNIDEGKDLHTAVKMCCCDVATLLYNAEQNDTAGIVSEKDGNMSLTYESSAQAQKTLESKVNETVRLWLADTGLLYAGV